MTTQAPAPPKAPPVRIALADLGHLGAVVDLYAAFVRGEIVLTDATTAEMVKLMENTYRDVNIALANEFGRLAERLGVDVWEAVALANLHPRVDILKPGPGVGGHCIPVDPYYLAWKAREFDFHMDFVELAARVNEDMPYFAATKILLALNGDHHDRASRVLVLGVTFKRDVADYRDSPAVKIMEILRRKGAEVSYHDPHVPTLPFDDGAFDVAHCSLLLHHLDPHDAVRAFRELRRVSTRGEADAIS